MIPRPPRSTLFPYRRSSDLIKFRPKTEEHDMEFKVKHVRRFLEGGNKVRLAVVFRGREITHPQTGMKVLNRVVELCRSEEHTSELQSQFHLVCRLLLEKKNN